MVTRAVSGHWLIRGHAECLNFFSNDFCISCSDEEEVETSTSYAIALLVKRRQKQLGYMPEIGDSAMSLVDIVLFFSQVAA